MDALKRLFAQAKQERLTKENWQAYLRLNDIFETHGEALRAFADEQEEYEPSHGGSCGPESGCDAACMANAAIARRNHQRRVVRELLAELEGL